MSQSKFQVFVGSSRQNWKKAGQIRTCFLVGIFDLKDVSAVDSEAASFAGWHQSFAAHAKDAAKPACSSLNVCVWCGHDLVSTACSHL